MQAVVEEKLRLFGSAETVRTNCRNTRHIAEFIRNMDGLTSGLMVDGAEANTGEDDNFMVENVQLVKYNSAGPYFENVGEILDFEGQTAEVTPADLIES